MELLTKINKAITYKVVFYKHFYKFVFLHKPLCEKFKKDTFKIFGLYVCRSCFWLYLGFLISAVCTILSVKTVQFDKYFYLGLAGCVFTFLMSYPTIYKNFGRITRDFVRFYGGIFLAAVFVMSFKFDLYIGFCSILGFVIMRNFYNKKRKAKDICCGCEELNNGETCAGYILQNQALLKIEEEYSNIMMKRKGMIL